MKPFDELTRLFRSWWCSDRIRISPATGRILALRPHEVLLIHGQCYEIAGRTVQQLNDVVHIRLELVNEDGPCWLWTQLRLSSAGTERSSEYSLLQTADSEAVVYDHDVVILRAATEAGGNLA